MSTNKNSKYNKQLNLVVDMYGCPNRCKHCWIGHVDYQQMETDADVYIVNYFQPYFDKIAFYSWLREPDFTGDYEKRWNRDLKISVNCKPKRYELASFYQLNRDSEYVHFLKKIGVKKVQLTFFGMKHMTDFYIGRTGAFEELLNAVNILLEHGIVPRFQLFINQENKEDIVEFMAFTKSLELEKRCREIGQEFEMFVHEGSCDGENAKLYDIRINREDIPEEVIPYYMNYVELMTEQECCKLLKDSEEIFTYHNEEDITLNITSTMDVYFNFTNMSKEWKIGNLLEDCREELIEKIVGEDTEALRKSRQVRIGTLVRKYGDFQSHRVFLLNDFKAYLLNCFIES